MYKYNDNELLYLVAENDDEALNLLLKKYKPLVVKYATKMTKEENEVDDYVQEGMLCIVKAINTFNEKYPYSFNSYLNIILKRKFIDLAKKNKSDKNITYHECLGDYVVDYLSLFKDEEVEKIEENSVKLSNFELCVYQYKFIDDIKPKKIAEIMKKDTKQIYDAINRIKVKLGKKQ